MLYPWQTLQWQQFSQHYEQQRIPHALLISGVEGLGQGKLAEHIVASLLCETIKSSTEVCGQCHSCQLFSAGNHPDHTVIAPEEAGKQIKIEQIRELKAKQMLTSTVSQWKTVIVDPADAMTISAYNSLLKLLEEPQDNTLLILITTKLELLPITILSRCQMLNLTVPDSEQTIAWSKQQGDYSQNDVEKVIDLAKGAPLAVIDMLNSDIAPMMQQVAEDFEQILQGRANPVSLAKEWQQFDVSILFDYLQILLKKRIIDSSENQQTDDNNRNWIIYDCIIDTIKLLSSSHNLNKVLLIEKFIVLVMDSKNTENNTTNRLF